MALQANDKCDETSQIEQINFERETRVTKFISEIVKPKGGASNEKQLQLIIENAVKDQVIRCSSSGSRYAKSYNKRIDNLRMPLGYNPPKLQQLDSKGNRK